MAKRIRGLDSDVEEANVGFDIGRFEGSKPQSIGLKRQTKKQREIEFGTKKSNALSLESVFAEVEKDRERTPISFGGHEEPICLKKQRQRSEFDFERSEGMDLTSILD